MTPLRIPQSATIRRTAHMRQSSESAFPLRDASGMTWADRARSMVPNEGAEGPNKPLGEE